VWRGRITARQVLALIDRLPRDSHFIAALADDDDLADELADEDDGPPPPPPLTEWSPVVDRLTAVVDLLGQLIATTAGAAGAKAKPPPPQPRPVTARDRAKRRRREFKRSLISDRIAEAAAAGRPTMADVVADATGQARTRKGQVVNGTTP
jgi:hypothetical protein